MIQANAGALTPRPTAPDRLVRDVLGDEVSLVLSFAAGAMDYYARIGMARAENAFMVMVKRNR